MSKLVQKDKYEEEDSEDKGLDIDEDSESVKTTPFRIDSKNIKIIAIVFIILIIIIITIILILNNTSKDIEPDLDILQPNSDGTYGDSLDNLNFYDESTKELLRSYGYTGYDIEQHEKAEDDPQYLIETVVLQRKEVLRNTYAELKAEAYKAGSQEYKDLLDSTWLSEEPKNCFQPNPADYTTTMEVANLDYEKLAPRGNQLFLKVIMKDKTKYFMEISPGKYQTLDDSGNIVVEYEVVEYGDEIFIQNMREKNVY